MDNHNNGQREPAGSGQSDTGGVTPKPPIFQRIASVIGGIALVVAAIGALLAELDKLPWPDRSDADASTETSDDTTSDRNPSEQASVAAPLSVIVETDPRVFLPEVDWTPFAYVFDTTLGQIQAPPSGDCRTWHSWARDLGAADSGANGFGTMFQVSVTSRSDGPILIDGFDVEVRRRGPPIHGVEARCLTGGADLNPRRVEIDLDKDPASIHYLADPNVDSEPQNLTISLAPDEIEVFEVWAFTEGCDCEWIAALNFVADGTRGRAQIASGDAPFRTSGSRNADTWRWDEAAGDWVE